ncbi:MAG TPA: IS630 family transposase [Blastocatellia bacterium]|nr:IS630 family transposase [Blastocatellia bacterium]
MQTTALLLCGERPASRPKKGAIIRQLKQMPAGAVLLFEDETIVRLFPVLRRAWSLRGKQALVPITGRNAKCVLFGTLNPQTGHRIVLCRPNMRQENFQDFLRLLRRSYPGREIWLLLDEAPCHVAQKSQVLAKQLNMELIWLPKQCPELNAMDQLWRELKNDISANYQFQNIEEQAAWAQEWILSLTKREALLKASVLSKNFWLRSFFK